MSTTINDKIMLVGFGHKARMGKGTVVSTIYDTYKDKFNIRVIGFGDALKEEVNTLDQFETCLKAGIEYDFNAPTNDPLCPTKHGKQSRLLQYWGEMRRQQDSFYWVKKVRDKLLEEKPTIALIHDMRYKNEFFFVKSVGGFTVHVNRQGFVDLTRDPKHISEVNLDGAPYDVDINVADGELEQLKRDAITVFELLIAQSTPDMTGFEDNSKPVEPKPLVVLA